MFRTRSQLRLMNRKVMQMQITSADDLQSTVPKRIKCLAMTDS